MSSKRTDNGNGSLRKRSDGRWEGRCTIGYDPETGKQVQRSVYLRFHDLRHTYAVNSLRAGDDIKTVQENLGHATASFTLGTYAHATPGMKRESANRMNDFIHNLTGEK